jgi:hydroxymethylglutaryl-CoA reductase
MLYTPIKPSHSSQPSKRQLTTIKKIVAEVKKTLKNGHSGHLKDFELQSVSVRNLVAMQVRYTTYYACLCILCLLYAYIV